MGLTSSKICEKSTVIISSISGKVYIFMALVDLLKNFTLTSEFLTDKTLPINFFTLSFFSSLVIQNFNHYERIKSKILQLHSFLRQRTTITWFFKLLFFAVMFKNISSSEEKCISSDMSRRE